MNQKSLDVLHRRYVEADLAALAAWDAYCDELERSKLREDLGYIINDTMPLMVGS